MKLWHELTFRWLFWRWLWRAKKRRPQKVRVGNLPAFFRDLNATGLPYVLLRWFDETPWTPAAERAFTGDLDLLVDYTRLRELCRVVARHPGRIKVDLYTDTARLGTGYQRLPYYPPVLAREILASRVLHHDRFYRPSDALHLRALAYHLVYHKGLAAGLPTGCALPNPGQPEHDHEGELSRLDATLHAGLPRPFTLLGLHRWLRQENWSMPYDLLCRWPRRNAWHDELQRLEEQLLRTELGGLRDLLVFLIREDAVSARADAVILERLQRKFTVLDIVHLTPEQIARVVRGTRGGNWLEHGGPKNVVPNIAVVCHDHAPHPVGADSALGKKHTGVANANVFYKHALREELERIIPGTGHMNFLHSSDNDAESLTYLKAIYGEAAFPEKRAALLAALAAAPRPGA